MRACLCLILASVTIPLAATGQVDAGGADGGLSPDASPADATEGCGEVTYFGACTETGVAWCNDGELVVYDCGVDRPCGLLDCADGLACQEITGQGSCEANTDCFWDDTYGCNPSCYGYECLSAVGGECNVFFDVDLDGDGAADFWPCESSAGYGCVDGTCASSTTCDAETAQPRCRSNIIEYCYRGTYSGFDCSFGSTQPYECGNDSTGEATCLGQEGAQCSVSEGLECVTGLTCTGGICTSGSAHDAATGQDLARPVDAAGRDLSTAPDRFTSQDGGSTCSCAVGETCTASGECVPAGQRDAGVSSSPPLTHDVACLGCAQARPTALGLGAGLLLLLWRRRRAP